MPLIPPKLQIKSQPIERAVSIRFFGFLLDEHLSWKKHDKYIENKVSKCIDLLYKESSLPVLYYSYFHSIVMQRETMMDAMVMGRGHRRGRSGWFSIFNTSIFLRGCY